MPSKIPFCQAPVRVILLIALFATSRSAASAQASLVINGAAVTLTNNASLVVGNPASTAIRRLGTGYIQSEGAGNQVVWAIGAGDGKTYTVPFGNATGYWPVQFTAASGMGSAGTMVLSTFPTPGAGNSDDLPPGVTNMTITGGDNSTITIDRFWQLKPRGYTVNPSLTNLLFTFPDAEIAPPNTISKANLKTYRWNDPPQSWNDYIPASIVDTADNTVTVPVIAGNQLHDWWTLADVGTALPVTLIHFAARETGGQVLATWETAIEQNSDRFEIWRSKDGQQFEYVGQVAAAGNSSVQKNYSFTDKQPYPGVSFYRLKNIDLDQHFTWSAIANVKIDETNGIVLYPSPALSYIGIQSNAEIINSYPMAGLYDSQGKRLRTFRLTAIIQQLDISSLAPGVYQLNISYDSRLKILRFIKL
ncbi:MAG TPA: T9SS type A sorting domain-containing protein [Puia sp.]|nr:T9SS type A sorting domain-containing protein [Puia sp.]